MSTDKPGIPSVPTVDSPALYQLLQALKQNLEYGSKLTAQQKADLTTQINALESSLTGVSDDLTALDASTTASIAALSASIALTYLVAATAADYRANAAGLLGLTPSAVWSAANYVALTDAATILLDFDTGFNFSVSIAGDRTLGSPTNVKVGQAGCIIVSATGASRTLTFGTSWKTIEANVQTIPSGQRLYIYYHVHNSTLIIITGMLLNPV